MIHSREDIRLANRIVIKAGTSVVSTPDGYPSITRMASIVEHAARLVQQGKEVIIVTSGAVGVGRQRLAKQKILHRSMSDLLVNRDPSALRAVAPEVGGSYSSACAAAGQLGLMSLYETMFTQFNITVSQLLVTSFDFTSSERRRNIQHVLTQLLALGIVPLLNENDAAANQGYEIFGKSFSDNDSLASLVSVEMSAHLLILLTDVKGVFDRPPSEPDAKIISVFEQNSTEFKVGSKSLQGRGGMGAKVEAALKAIDGGVPAVVIAAGHDPTTIGNVLAGEDVGTLFLQPETSTMGTPNESTVALTSLEAGSSPGNNQNLNGNGTSTPFHVHDLSTIAAQCRMHSRHLSSVSSHVRKNILLAVSRKLLENANEILEVNQQDIIAAEGSGMAKAMLARLKLSQQKLQSLSTGIRQIAEMDDPIQQLKGKWQIADELVLEKISCPIGVILVIFESRPDCLPQIAALAIKSGNGLILKGGKEAHLTNEYLHNLIADAIEEASEGQVSRSIVNLVNTREDVKVLLKMDEYIDLVIPRGSNDLVKSIMANTKIQVLGHADGVCHIYVDASADEVKAQRILLDAKLDYPAACNAAETMLFHRHHVETGLMEKVLRMLRKEGVTVYGSERVKAEGFCEQLVVNFHHEYGDLAVAVEIVDDIHAAIDHINQHSSSHTECIITEDESKAKEFFARVDSACVFHNSSTRFADGYRFGLGAEVGISTSRIHARGPVGVEGLLSYKWLLKSTSKEGHIAASNFPPVVGSKTPIQYVHQKISDM